MNVARLWLLVVFGLSAACVAPDSKPTQSATQSEPQSDKLEDTAQIVSLVALLSDPQRFDGVDVVTSGILAAEPEHSAIYLNQLSLDFLLLENALYLYAPPSTLGQLKGTVGQVVRARGKFHAGPCGHLRSSAACFSAEQVWKVVRRDERAATKPEDLEYEKP